MMPSTPHSVDLDTLLRIAAAHEVEGRVGVRRHPIRLTGRGLLVEAGTGRVLADTGDRQTITVRRRNRRAARCPACSTLYKFDSALDVEITGLLGIYTDPAHVIAYADGEVRQEFAISYLARIIGGSIMPSDESTEVRFVDPAEFDHLPIHETVRLRLRDVAEGRPYLG